MILRRSASLSPGTRLELRACSLTVRSVLQAGSWIIHVRGESCRSWRSRTSERSFSATNRLIYRIREDDLVKAAANSEGLTPVQFNARYHSSAISVGGARTAFAAARIPFASVGAGEILRGGAPSARDLAISSYYANHFGRTSDNLLSEFDFDGLQSQVRFSIRLIWALSQVGATPTN